MLNIMCFSLILLVTLHLYLLKIKLHFLGALLTLEAMVLFLLILTVSLSYSTLEGLNIYYFVLTLSVCEAAFGLTLLISVVKLKGSDLINSNYNM
uniref:NADH-ubiquinone oxidoreductase chain 4L n=1 Tax=Zaptyx hyperoptyx TaxID=1885887 RepID=A0A224A221_9EUPU|nr:NADH dehydrogenase subunit 4L [Zaptyx hyperoptyx]